jgi:hypothetical protein
MVEATAIGIGLVVAGGVLLFFGAALSVYGVALLGAVLGGAAGSLIAPTIGSLAGVSGLLATVLAIGVGALVGILVAYMVLSMVVAIAGFAVGNLVGLYLVTDLAGVGGMLPKAGVAIATGIAIAFLAMFLTKTALVGITSFVGAAFASTALTADAFETAANDVTVEPLIVSFENPVFLGLLVVGVLVQFGLFKLGWFGKFAKVLPGAGKTRDRGEGGQAS